MKDQCRKSQWVLILIVCCVCGCTSRKPTAPAEDKPPLAKDSTPEAVTPMDNTTAIAKDGGEPSADALQAKSANPSAANPSASSPPVEQAPTWTVKRIFALSANGPICIDVSINICAKAIDEASEVAVDRALARIDKDLEKPWTWKKLLDHPLVRSGWLGSITTSTEQQDELIARFNKDGDDEVEVDELRDMLTHGLTRDSTFQFTDVSLTDGGSMGKSPWQQLDANQDFLLDPSEIENLTKALAGFDQDNDQSISFAEVQEKSPMMTATNMSSTQKKGTGIYWDSNKRLSKFAENLIFDYGSDIAIARDQWNGWSDAKWSEVDQDKNGYLNKTELERLGSMKPDLELMIQFQRKSESTPSLSAKVAPGIDLHWSASQTTTGQATGKSAVLSVEVNDKFILTDREKIRQQFQAALTDPQVAGTIKTQLKLNDGAIELIDADDDDKLNDEEFDIAWEWLSLIRGNRIAARWMFAEPAWFRMGDIDADGRFTQKEQSAFRAYVASLDQDKDGGISPSEFPLAVWQNPLVIRLEFERTGDQLGAVFPTDTEKSNSAEGWFAASDSNNDKSVSKSEFLGSLEDFRFYDGDNDGIISASEAYKNPAPKVQ